MRKTLQIFLIVCLSNCTENHIDKIQYRDGKQILSANRIDRHGNKIDSTYLNTFSTDTVKIGDKFSARVFLMDAKFKIADARFDCFVTNESLVDTSKHRIVGCDKGLMVDQDTFRVHFVVSGETGSKSFPEITVLSKDKENVYRYHKVLLKYFVKE